MSRRLTVVVALGTTQTLTWASTYYLPAILAVPIARDLGLSSSEVFAMFTGALIVSALLGPAAGRAIDRYGGRGILVLSNLVCAAGLTLLAFAQGPVSLGAAWLILGIGMSIGLYDAAFAVLAWLYGRSARGVITGITLFAGFASTVGWPISALLGNEIGWRGACLVWAILHLAVGLPLNGFLIPAVPEKQGPHGLYGENVPSDPPRYTMALLAFVFAAVWFVTGAMAAHLPRLLEVMGATPATAITLAALVGPAQVAARLLEFGLLRQSHPLVSARIAALMHPLGAIVVLSFGGPATSALFVLLHGGGNGVLTIAKGTLPLALFGPVGYGLRQGLLGAPARLAQATAPLLFGLLIDTYGAMALMVSAAVSLAAFAALLVLRRA